MKTLFTTEVGSRMWGMEEFASDYDLVEIYQEDTKDILRGKSISTSLPHKTYYDEQGRLIDKQSMEIGHLINLLCKGNINAIWIATSPIVHNLGPFQHHNYYVLKFMVERNLSRITYNSIYGMSVSQEKDAIKRSDVRDGRKSRLTALRTIRFGIELLQNGILDYDIMLKYNPKDDVDYEELAFKRKKLLLAYELSTLPDKVNENPFRDLLYNIRMKNLS